MSSKYSKSSDPHRLLLNVTDKIDLKRKDKYIALSNFTIFAIYLLLHLLYMEKCKKSNKK